MFIRAHGSYLFNLHSKHAEYMYALWIGFKSQ